MNVFEKLIIRTNTTYLNKYNKECPLRKLDKYNNESILRKLNEYKN